MKLTEWFRGVQPERPGVYQQMCGFGQQLGYQYWDGKKWHAWQHTPDQAFDARKYAPVCADAQHDKWRGITKTPNVK